jgi:predicted NACHT family NTPase
MAASKSKSKTVQQAKLLIDRRASEQDSREVRLLADWRDLDAYVLLGDPGAGKTRSQSLRRPAAVGAEHRGEDR